MAHKAQNGFIAPFVEGHDFTVEHKGDTYAPSGIFVHGGFREGVTMDYAGITAWSSFKLPTDVKMLKDVADAISRMADDIQAKRRASGWPD
jgi:hypothetical protein